MRRRPRTAPGLALLCLAALLAAAAGLPSSAASPSEPGSGSGGPAEGSPGTVPPDRPRGTAAPARSSAPPPPPPPEEDEEAAVAEEEEEEEEAAAAGSGPAGEWPTRVRDGGGRRQRGRRLWRGAGRGCPIPPPTGRTKARPGVGDGAAAPRAPSGRSDPRAGQEEGPSRCGTPGSISAPSPVCPAQGWGLGGWGGRGGVGQRPPRKGSGVGWVGSAGVARLC